MDKIIETYGKDYIEKTNTHIDYIYNQHIFGQERTLYITFMFDKNSKLETVKFQIYSPYL